MGSIMPQANQMPSFEQRYRIVELAQLRRQFLQYSRSVPPGPERNQHLQIAVSLRRLFKDKEWLDAHTVESSLSGNGSDQIARRPF
jgi:hypothetical protein